MSNDALTEMSLAQVWAVAQTQGNPLVVEATKSLADTWVTGGGRSWQCPKCPTLNFDNFCDRRECPSCGHVVQEEGFVPL